TLFPRHHNNVEYHQPAKESDKDDDAFIKECLPEPECQFQEKHWIARECIGAVKYSVLLACRTCSAQAGFSRADNGLSAVDNLELAEYIRDVVLYRFDTQHQPGSDVRVVVALSDQGQDLTLPLGQLGEG